MANARANMDVDTTAQDVAALASADAVAEFFQRRGYNTAKRAAMTTEAIGIADADGTFRRVELISEDPEGFLRVVFAQVRSITAKARNDLVRALGRFSQDHLIVLTSDFQVLEFVLIDKVKRRQHGPAAMAAYKPVPKVYSVLRKSPSRLDLRILRRLTFTQRDALDQFDKLRSVFEAAVYTGEYYQNRALFADHYLNTRLQESPVWAESPNAAFAAVRQIMADARERFTGKDEATTRQGLIEPLFGALDFKHAQGKSAKDGSPSPDYLLKDAKGGSITAALVYQWDRWLDGPDPSDQQTPEENPGASVVSVLERGNADWVIVTNGRLWRLYSRRAHSRSTNFYEVDLAEALVETGETDPGEAFRYWWLFFRPQAFAPLAAEQAEAKCWLDTVVAGSRHYAKQVEERLKKRVFEHIVPHLAMGFLADRKGRLGLTKPPTDEELEATREGCLTLLYRLLFLLYAESRDLLPVRESPYYAASLRKIKAEIDGVAGVAESEVDDKLAGVYKRDQTKLYDRLTDLSAVMDAGDPALNVPTYNGGLFLAKPEKGDDSREARIARFLKAHKVPDLFLAQAIDHLSRDPDEKTFGMVFIDYKSLGVRQLGSIYEGLLEFKLKIAAEDLTTVKEKGAEKVIPLAAATGRKRAEVVVRKGEVYLANDKSERRASGSYYTPDHIVEYIVENTVGPVLAAKLEALRPALRQAEKTYHRWLANLKTNPQLCAGAAPREFAADKTYAEHKELVDSLFDCKVLDPAMGSGHFLVEAVDFVTDKLLDFLNGFPVNPIATALEHTRRSILDSLADQGVAVDPDKLTDVHLLKRHVLKRCIYGVDLNPMAVELAKVSLWLDAFTLGAPLSFLDHHLRCGNSLIGATFEDMEKAVSGNLQPIEFQRMHDAIHNVLTVAAMADATASEVHRSAKLFAAASKALSGYKILLDILVAKHFGEFGALTLLQMYGNQLDLESADKLMAGLTGLDRKSIDKVEAIAKPRRFFHWDLEFPECFFGLRPGTQRQIEHKLPAEAGFDAVVGNPPYAGHKGDFDAKPLTLFFEVCRNYPNPATAFCEKAITVLTLSGRYGLILPKSIQYVEAWSDARTLLAKANTLDRLVDVSQAFEDVLLEQTICVGQKANSSESYLAAVAGAKAVGNHNVIPLTVLNDFGCLPAVLEQGSLDLLQFIASLGAKLGGISYTCQALGYQAKINLPAGGERLPIYRGRHVRPMRIDDTGDWIDRNYLTKSASTEFTDKVSAMLEPKVVSQNIVAHVTQPKPRVWIISSPDLKGIVCLNTISTTYIRDPRFPVPFIAAVLNSSLASWFFYEFVFCRAVRTMHFDDYYAGKLPVPVPTKATVTACETLVSDCQTPLSRSERQAAVDKIVFKAYQLSPEMQDFVHRYCYGTNDLSVLDGTSEPATEEATDA